MKPQLRPYAIELLKLARDKYLWDGQYGTNGPRHICFAINQANGARRGAGYKYAAEALDRYIQHAIYPHGTYAGWVSEHYPNLFILSLDPEFDLQRGRIAWINWMIKQLERQG